MKNYFFSFLLFSSIISAQNIVLQNPQNQFDYVIITIENYKTACEKFKLHKETHNNFSVLVTTKNQILSEFDKSNSIQENIRDFISFTNHYWQNPRPKYFLLAANVDSIPNFKFRSVENKEYNDTSFSDFNYGIDKLGVDSTKLSFSVGRISVRDSIELDNYFSKVIEYETKDKIDEWQSKSLFVTDDEFNGNINYGLLFINLAYSVANSLPNNIKKDFVIPIDTSKYYGNNQTIIEKLNSGVSSVFFCGMASNEVFTNESLFTYQDLDKISNESKPYFVSFLGKQQFEKSGQSSIVNEMVISKEKALAALNSVGVGLAQELTNFIQNFWKQLYSGISIGENFIQVENNFNNRFEKRKFNIFGDPSIVLDHEVISDINKQDDILPTQYILYQNYPNPFNPTTKIKYLIKNDGISTLKVFDILGNELKTIVNEFQKAGEYSFTFDASELPSAIYFYTLSSGNFHQTKKMILMK